MVSVWILAALILGGVIAVSLLNNQVMFAVFLVVVGFVGVVIYLYMKKEKHIDPLEEFKTQLTKECFSPDNKLNFLILSGGKQYGISHQQRVRGKILGYTSITLKSPKRPRGKVPKRKPWDTLYIFLINPRGDSGLARLKDFLFNLPILDMFKEKRFFAVTPEQLGDNDLTFGNVVLMGTATTTVGIFEMLNSLDLDKNYVLNYIGEEVHRITLREQLRKVSVLVDRASKSDADFIKTFKLVKDEPDQPNTFGIKQ